MSPNTRSSTRARDQAGLDQPVTRASHIPQQHDGDETSSSVGDDMDISSAEDEMDIDDSSESSEDVSKSDDEYLPSGTDSGSDDGSEAEGMDIDERSPESDSASNGGYTGGYISATDSEASEDEEDVAWSREPEDSDDEAHIASDYGSEEDSDESDIEMDGESEQSSGDESDIEMDGESEQSFDDESDDEESHDIDEEEIRQLVVEAYTPWLTQLLVGRVSDFFREVEEQRERDDEPLPEDWHLVRDRRIRYMLDQGRLQMAVDENGTIPPIILPLSISQAYYVAINTELTAQMAGQLTDQSPHNSSVTAGLDETLPTFDTDIPLRRVRRERRNEIMRYFSTIAQSGVDLGYSDQQLRASVQAEEAIYTGRLTELRRTLTRVDPDRVRGASPYADIDDFVTDQDEEIDARIMQLGGNNDYLRTDLVQARNRANSRLIDFLEANFPRREDVPTPGDLSLVEDLPEYAEGAECPICKEVLQPASALEPGSKEITARLARCEHVFHRECIEHWLETKKTCPMCRTRVERE